MLLSLDKTISFHLYFKESKFGKNSAKHGEGRKPSQKNMKGKDKKHLTFFDLVLRTRAVVGSGETERPLGTVRDQRESMSEISLSKYVSLRLG